MLTPHQLTVPPVSCSQGRAQRRESEMTDSTIILAEPAVPGRVAGRLRRHLREVSDRAHAAGDAHAQAMGWTIAQTPGPLGLSGRTYRDPRFDARRPR